MYIVCSDELPELLSLPDVLATASSLQNLASLSLLGKSKIDLNDKIDCEFLILSIISQHETKLDLYSIGSSLTIQ